ncbi:Crp/Fnr family transcriptional regulator [Bosea sp. PAMC 26642]|uniref:Crp/Fnr family transcriptional regulator n=1 Tax=Bosea sp. (strain PAMC 26642) TaxID=1792307 RepID=UPI0007703816|nr:Crp/Fnr family transcriptional regulator [Bosea sp. PAMC 26642]AMJ62768.1 Crp/Fnr family transcriptional regulator [Bosea sp. PAMC 26642]
MAEAEHLHALLRKMESISDLSAQDKESLLALPVTIRHYDGNTDIISEGNRTRHCCLVLDGLLCRYKTVENGNRQILSLHVPGDIPDLHSLHIEVMDHSLGTLSPSRVGFIPHEAVLQLTRSSYRIAEAFWREALIDAAVFREWMVGIGRRPAQSRLAHLLCEFATKTRVVGLSDGLVFELPMTQTEIGDALGLSTVHTNKTLKALRKSGLIEIRARRMKVLDWNSLCELGEFDPTYLHLRK